MLHISFHRVTCNLTAACRATRRNRRAPEAERWAAQTSDEED
jgi:hypothetical protein